MRKRAARRTPIQQTNSPYNRPELGKPLAYKANRDGVAARCPEPAVQKSIEVDRALIDHDDRLRGELALSLVKTAQPHDAPTLYGLQTVPGSGNMLRLVRLSAIHALPRFPSVHEFVSSCRLVTCAQEAAGQRYGPSGPKIGHASLQGGVSAAAVLGLRNHPPGQQDRARLEHKQGQGQALPMLAPTRARAVSDMLQRHTAFDLQTCLQP